MLTTKQKSLSIFLKKQDKKLITYFEALFGDSFFCKKALIYPSNACGLSKKIRNKPYIWKNNYQHFKCNLTNQKLSLQKSEFQIHEKK